MRIHNCSSIEEILSRRYRALQLVNQGGMSWIFRAWDPERELYVGIKVLYPHFSHQQNVCERFLREGQVLSRLDHPHIVKVFDTIQDDGVVAHLLEWVEGEDAKGLCMRILPPFKLSDIWKIMSPVVNAMAYAHQEGIVHRDAKLSNFLIRWEGSEPLVKVTDFGIVKVLDAVDERKTRTDALLGTVYYMSPEQIRETRNVDQRADIYSLGICLYHLSTGSFPYSGKKRQVMLDTLFEEPLSPNHFNKSLDQDFSRAILRCLEKDPEKRFSTCEELRNNIESILDRMEDAPSHSSFPRLIPLKMPNLPHPPTDLISHTSLMEPISLLESNGENKRGTTFSTGYFWLIVFGFFALPLLVFFSMNLDVDTTARPLAIVKNICQDGEIRPCYTGPKSTRRKGLCKDGIQVCQSGIFGDCQGQELPLSDERCNGVDDDCNGKIDDSMDKVTSSCTLKQGECRFKGFWKCMGKKGLVCQKHQDRKATVRYVSFDVRPEEALVRVVTRSRRHVFQGKVCLPILKHRKKTLVILKSPGYHACRFYVHLNSPIRIQISLRLRRKYPIEPPMGYCLH